MVPARKRDLSLFGDLEWSEAQTSLRRLLFSYSFAGSSVLDIYGINIARGGGFNPAEKGGATSLAVTLNLGVSQTTACRDELRHSSNGAQGNKAKDGAG